MIHLCILPYVSTFCLMLPHSALCFSILPYASAMGLEILNKIQRTKSNVIGPSLSCLFQSQSYRSNVTGICLYINNFIVNYFYAHTFWGARHYERKRTTIMVAKIHYLTVEIARYIRNLCTNCFLSRTMRLWNTLQSTFFPVILIFKFQIHL